MDVRHRLEDYPEHLNPFHSRRNSFKQSMRVLKNTLVRSFRGNDKKRPEIRRREDGAVSTSQPSRHTLPVIPRVEVSEATPLPRSRFSERVTRKTLPPDNQSEERNPFDDEAVPKNETTSQMEPLDVPTPPCPAPRRKIKKKKKKAPVPPNADSSLVVPLNINDSKWSLVSTESEFSSTCPSDYEADYDPPEFNRIEEILQITEEIKKFTDDSSNVNASSEMIRVELPEENQTHVNVSKEMIRVELPEENQTNVNASKEMIRVELPEESQTNVDTSKEMIQVDLPEENRTEVDGTKEIQSNGTTVIEKSNYIRDNKITDDQNNNTDVIINHDKEIVERKQDPQSETKILFVERKSVSIDRLESIEENSIVERRIEQFEQTSSLTRERSKVRQQIPSKENMLG